MKLIEFKKAMRPKKYLDGDFVLYTGEESVGMADGGRIGFAEGTMKIRDALQEIIVEKGTNFSSQKELTDLVAEKIGYEPNIKILRPSKYPILRKVTYDSTSKPFTEKELREILGDDYDRFIEEGLSDKKIKERASSRKQFQNMSPEQRQKKLERNRLRIERLDPQQRALFNERAAIRQQEIRGTKPKYHRVSNAKSLLWNDLIRAAELEDSELSFKNFTPEKGKYYNKAQTENIVLVDRKGNEFKFSSLRDDINKYSGFDAEEVFKPYAQREFLNKQGLTQKLNQAYGFKPGSRQSVFNIQHVQGIAKNPFNVQLTFADQNIAEAGAKRTFDVDFKKATTLSGKKAAVKKFYDNLGADIATQLGKKEVGNRRTLEELLKKTKVPIDDSIMELVRDNPKLQMRVPLLADLFEMAQSIPDDIKKSNYLKAGFKTLGIAATPLVIYDTYKAYEAGQPVLEALEKGFLGTDMLGGTKRILALTPEEREARSVVKQDEMDTQIAQDFAGLDIDFAQPRIKTDLTLEDAQEKAVAGDERVRALEAEKNLQRARARGFRDDDMTDQFLADGGRVNLSIGGITKGAQLVFKTARQVSSALLDLKNSVFSNFHEVRFAKTPEETAKGIKKVLEPYTHPKMTDKSRKTSTLESIDNLKKVLPEEYHNQVNRIKASTEQNDFISAYKIFNELDEGIDAALKFENTPKKYFPMLDPMNDAFIILDPTSRMSQGRYMQRMSMELDKVTGQPTGKYVREFYDTWDPVNNTFRKPGEEVLQGISTDKGKKGLN